MAPWAQPSIRTWGWTRFWDGSSSQYVSIPGPSREGPSPADLSVVTDDRPFYVDIARGLHPTLARLLELALAATALTFLPTAVSARRAAGARGLRIALLCTILGVAFMLVEVALIQRLALVVGFPTRSLSLTLLALLAAGALGSALGARLGAPLPGLLVLAALAVAYGLLLPRLLPPVLGQPLSLRLLAAAVLVLVPGLLMGRPLPGVLERLPPRLAPLVPSFWAVNGVAAVLGSVGAVCLAKLVGWSGVLLVAGGLYALAAALASGMAPAPPGRTIVEDRS